MDVIKTPNDKLLKSNQRNWELIANTDDPLSKETGPETSCSIMLVRVI